MSDWEFLLVISLTSMVLLLVGLVGTCVLERVERRSRRWPWDDGKEF